MRQLRLNPIRDLVVSAVYQGTRARLLDEFVKRNARIHIFAGAIRDAIASHYQGQGDGIPRDFDIGISNVKREVFDSILSEHGVQNRHRGYILKDGILPTWDVWRLEDTIGLRKTNSVCCLENVLRSFNLSCNAIALDVRNGLFTDAGAIDAIRRKRLTFVRHPINHSQATFAAKALLVQLRFGYCADEATQRFIAKHLQHPVLVYESRKVFPGLIVVDPSANGPEMILAQKHHARPTRPCNVLGYSQAPWTTTYPRL